MTDAVIFKNNASSRLGIPIPAASITITVEAGTGSRFPAPAAAQFFPVIVQDRRTDQFEIMYCTQRVNDILTVTRAQEGTIAQDFLLGASVWSTATAATWATYFAYSWSRDEADARYVNVTGDTMTGLLVLPGNPVLAKHATTKEWVEALVGTITSVVEAPNDGLPYARQSVGWVVSVRKVDYDADMATIAAAFTADDIDIAALQAKDLVHDAAIALRLTDAPNNANYYGRQGAGWQIVVGKVTYDAYVASNDAAVALRLTDAPNDAFIYARAAAAWVKTITKTVYDAYVAANDAAVALRLTDAPNNGNEYVRKNGLWSILGAALTDAASDGFLYGRRNAVWTKAVQLAGDTMSGLLILSANPVNVLGAVTKQYADAITTAFTAADVLKANIASPTFTGNPLAPTPAALDNDTSIATSAFVQGEIASHAVRYDAAQALTLAQALQAHANVNDTNSVFFKAAPYTLLPADRNKLLYISAACTITLTAANVGNDFAIDFKTTGGAVTFTASTGVITDGAASPASIIVPDGYLGKLWCDGVNWHLVRVPLDGGQLWKRTVVTSSNAAFAIDPATKFLFVEVIGAGASGGGQTTGSAGACGSGSGGGGGGYVAKFFARGTITTAAIVIGAGPTGVANNGSNGGTSSWTDAVNTLTAGGGLAGLTTGPVTSLNNIEGGLGGTATGGDTNIPGGPGHNSLSLGSVAMTTARMSNSGNGGSTPRGMGGKGAVATASAATQIANAGLPGTGFGGGGGGGSSINTAVTCLGGNGANGGAIVWEFK